MPVSSFPTALWAEDGTACTGMRDRVAGRRYRGRGETGRRNGLKIRFHQWSRGSSPLVRTSPVRRTGLMPAVGAWRESGRTLDLLLDLARRVPSAVGVCPEGTAVRLVNLSENATWRLDGPSGERWILRIHREGYHSREGIQTELDWLHALQRDTGLVTPQAIAGVDGSEIQEGTAEGLPRPRQMVLFEFIEGVEPAMDDDLEDPFRRLGEVSARLHLHAIDWQRPPYFERLTWDAGGVLGPAPNWGDWREGPLDDARQSAFLQRVESDVKARLEAFGRDPERFGLAHCDLRLGNLLLVGDDTRVIDFDDSGTSWFLYDLASALTLIDNRSNTRELVEAWLDGYRSRRRLESRDLMAVPALVMLRRFAILAWFGSHAETDLARDHREGFAADMCAMGEAYLSREPSPATPFTWLWTPLVGRARMTDHDGAPREAAT